MKWIRPDNDFDATKRAINEAVDAASCSLSPGELAEQRSRQARLAGSVEAFDRRSDAIRVSFRPGFDRHALEEMVGVEQRCCRFLRFAFNEGRRELLITVDDEAMLPALEAVALHFGARHSKPVPVRRRGHGESGGAG